MVLHPEAQAVKTCRECKVEKPETDFYADTRYRGGRINVCKPCKIALVDREKNKARQHANGR